MSELQTSSANQTERGIRQVHAAGQGCMTLTVITSTSATSLVAAATTGDVAAKAGRSTGVHEPAHCRV
jgi:hypothetical protein